MDSVLIDTRAREYVIGAFRIFNKREFPDLSEKTKALNNISEITSNKKWRRFIMAVCVENYLLTKKYIDSSTLKIYNNSRGKREEILTEFFYDYGLTESP